jgi:glycosyltransferase involved in cell wall biosynthesis
MSTETSERPAVAVTIPAYNEAEGLPGFLQEIDQALAPQVSSLRLIVVDDASTDGTVEAMERIRASLTGELEIVVNRQNQGHGPSVLTGYRRALASSPDFVMQVDGDGQFHGSDLRRLLVLLVDGARAVSGVRRFRQDPWFRMMMTRWLRGYVRWRFGVAARDPNCPLRGYESDLLEELLAVVPDSSMIPNLYLTVVASHRGVALLEVDVSHRVRRGGSAAGTSWSQGRSPIPWRLVRFSLAALRESQQFRRQIDTPHWARHAGR